MTKRNGTQLAIAITIGETTNTFSNAVSAWITAYVAEIKPDAKEGWEYVSRYGNNSALSRVCMRGLLMSDAQGAKVGACQVISTDLGYSKAYEIEPVLKALKSLNAKVDKLAAIYGCTDNFVQSVLYFARAVGAKDIIVQSSKDSQSGRRYHTSDTRNGEYNLQYNIREWFNQYGPKTVQTL